MNWPIFTLIILYKFLVKRLIVVNMDAVNLRVKNRYVVGQNKGNENKSLFVFLQTRLLDIFMFLSQQCRIYVMDHSKCKGGTMCVEFDG